MFILKRNQVIITALVVMIAVAGYLNFSDSVKSEETAMILTDDGEPESSLVYDTLPDDQVFSEAFDESDYKTLGYRIKCNPAIKSAADSQALTDALNSGKIDAIGTDHAPHLTTEKFGDSYFTSASGMPSIQHSLLVMLDLCKAGKTSIENVVRKMCHAPADIFKIDGRGYIRPGYKADIVIVDHDKPQTVTTANTLYKCGWSPFEGHTFGSTVTHTFVNGTLVYRNGEFVSDRKGEALRFNR